MTTAANISGTWNELTKNHEALLTKLVAHHFDPLSGVKIHAVQGAERRALELQVVQSHGVLEEQREVLKALKLQRDLAAAAQAQAFEDAQAVSQRMEEAVAEELFKLEAQRIAQERFSRGRG